MVYRYEDPARDAEAYYCDNEPKSIGNCECCSDVICEGENYYDIEGELIHEDCLRDWAEKYKRTA